MSVTDFPASSYMSVEQAIALASREAANGEYTEVVVLASSQDGGRMVNAMEVRTSAWLWAGGEK